MASAGLDRVAALMAKEWAELRSAPGVLAGPVVMLATAVVTPFALAIGVPWWSGEALSDSQDVVELAAQLALPGMASLNPEAAVQAYVLHQFLPLLLLVPVVGAMALVTTSVIGEKQARSLEPLLATPITTFELLAAKTLSAFLVALALLIAGAAMFLAGAAVATQPGVAATLLSGRALALVAGLAPASAFVALMLGVIVSSRAKDARTAQQFGVIVVVPIVGLFLGQLGGQLDLDEPAILAITAALWVLSLVLAWMGVRIFDRERILIRWT